MKDFGTFSLDQYLRNTDLEGPRVAHHNRAIRLKAISQKAITRGKHFDSLKENK
jgi:hypothetical protein